MKYQMLHFGIRLAFLSMAFGSAITGWSIAPKWLKIFTLIFLPLALAGVITAALGIV